MYIYIYIHLSLSLYIYIYIYTYIHTYIHSARRCDQQANAGASMRLSAARGMNHLYGDFTTFTN